MIQEIRLVAAPICMQGSVTCVLWYLGGACKVMEGNSLMAHMARMRLIRCQAFTHSYWDLKGFQED